MTAISNSTRVFSRSPLVRFLGTPGGQEVLKRYGDSFTLLSAWSLEAIANGHGTFAASIVAGTAALALDRLAHQIETVPLVPSSSQATENYWDVFNETARASGKDPIEFPKFAFTGHRLGHPLTERLISLILQRSSRKAKNSVNPIVLEVGALDGRLSRLVAQRGVPVLSTDLLPVAAIHSPHRTADMRTLEGIGDQTMEVVFSSFAAEYMRPDSWRSIARVLKDRGHLVALVHHKNSILASQKPLIEWFGSCLWLLVKIIPFLSKAMTNQLRFLLSPGQELRRIAYQTREELEQELSSCDFNNIMIDPFYGSLPSVPEWAASRSSGNLGWIVTAKKRKTRKL